MSASRLFSRVLDLGWRVHQARHIQLLSYPINHIQIQMALWCRGSWCAGHRRGPWEAAHVASQPVQEDVVVAQKSFFHFTRGQNIVFCARTRCQANSFFFLFVGITFSGKEAGRSARCKQVWCWFGAGCWFSGACCSCRVKLFPLSTRPSTPPHQPFSTVGG